MSRRRRPDGDMVAITVLDEVCPCDDCPFAAQCRDEQLACHAFSLYVNQRPHENAHAWMDGYVMPSRVWFDGIAQNSVRLIRIAGQQDRAAVAQVA